MSSGLRTKIYKYVSKWNQNQHVTYEGRTIFSYAALLKHVNENVTFSSSQVKQVSSEFKFKPKIVSVAKSMDDICILDQVSLKLSVKKLITCKGSNPICQRIQIICTNFNKTDYLAILAILFPSAKFDKFLHLSLSTSYLTNGLE